MPGVTEYGPILVETPFHNLEGVLLDSPDELDGEFRVRDIDTNEVFRVFSWNCSVTYPYTPSSD